MKKTFFCLLLVCATTGVINAQYSTPDSTRLIRKNEFLFNIGVFIPSINPSGLAMMYRRNFKGFSLRGQLYGNYSHNHASASKHTDSYTISPSVGIQKNIPVAKYLFLYYGADVIYSYQKINTASGYTEKITRYNTTSLAPLVGIRYNYKKLVVGAECGGSLKYQLEQIHSNSSAPYNMFTSDTQQNSAGFNMLSFTKILVGITF